MKIGKIVVTGLVGLIYWLIYLLWLPTLSLAYIDGFLFIALGIICILLLIPMWTLKANSDIGDYSARLPAIGCMVTCVVFTIGNIGGSALFNSQSMYNQIGTVVEKDFKSDVVELDTSQVPVVDLELAAKLADKKLGEEMALGSQMRVGKFTNKQQVNGKLIYVAPLEHSGLLKWSNNKSGTVGYVVVSATNPNDVKLVRSLGDKPIRLRYLESAYFGDDLKRHLRNSGYFNTGLTEYSFELDDDGNPYWVVTTYKNTTWWNNPEATGVVICDAQTGDCNWYSVSETPEWVDIIQPESFVIDQIKNYGSYVHGIFNFSQKDELTMTEHMTTVYNDGGCYYYTGLSSAGSDEGTVGFIMVNTRDKSSKLYRMVGATEAAAMRSAEGIVSDMGYRATTPIPLNISGVPSYFCTLKDAEGLVKRYAMLKIEDYSVVASGSSIMETKRSFINTVNSSGMSVDFGDEAYGYNYEGIVTRIGSNIENGNTYYYMVLDDDESRLFLASYMVSEELPITREGDKVEISYVDESNGTINIVYFDNIAFSQTLTPSQEEINKEQEENNLINNPEHSIVEVNPEENENVWESLTDEEKAKLLEDLDQKAR